MRRSYRSHTLTTRYLQISKHRRSFDRALSNAVGVALKSDARQAFVFILLMSHAHLMVARNAGVTGLSPFLRPARLVNKPAGLSASL
jgi:hypothetical protein